MDKSPTVPVTSSPFALPWSKLMMWFFIVNDGLLFGAFLASYGFSRLASSDWPAQEEVFSIPFLTLMTFVLISSSATMASAVASAQAGDTQNTRRFLLLTVLGGLVFLGMQAFEWVTLIGEGATPFSNPWGANHFGAYFFLITGFHGTHVLTGVLALAILSVRQRMGLATELGVELAGLYWHFVDLVWVFVFTCFYLI